METITGKVHIRADGRPEIRLESPLESEEYDGVWPLKEGDLVEIIVEESTA